MFNCSYWLIISPPCWRGHAKPRPHTAIRCALSALLLPPGRIPWQFLCLGTSLCMCLCVCMCLLYLPIHNVRNCNFSFHCYGIIKWQEYLMQLYAKWVCVYVCVQQHSMAAQMACTAADHWCTAQSTTKRAHPHNGISVMVAKVEKAWRAQKCYVASPQLEN